MLNGGGTLGDARGRPRQKRSLRTEAALLSATEKVAAAEGEAAVTTSRIAAETGVAVGTIYRYFADRDALLLAAYDATVLRIVEACGAALADLDPEIGAEDAARHLLDVYLAAARAIPGHAALLRAMRRIRSVEQDDDRNRNRVADGLLAPFLERFGMDAAGDQEALHFLNVLLGTLVDLYLIADDDAARETIHGHIEAHMLLALSRLMPGR